MKKTIISTDKAPAPIGPYSQAVKSGNTLYASGQIPINPATGELVGKDGNIEAETEQVMQNIKSILEASGMAFSDIVKCSIFVKDLNNFTRVNTIYGKYFDEAVAPARECVEVARLPKDVNVEISFIAIEA